MSVALLVGGIFVLQGKNPKLLLMISYVAIGVSLLSLIIGLAQGGSSAFSGILGIIVPGVIVALMLQPQSKQYFAARGQAY
jgi:F0F1-type ATP synthase assembly protein I